MGQVTLPGNPPVEITLRRSARARRVSLRVSGLDGRVTLSLPKGVAEATALAFAEEKSDWIRRHLAKRMEEVRPEVGGTLLFEGRERRILAGTGRCVRLEADDLLVPPQPGMLAARLKAFLKLQARGRLQAACEGYAERLGRRFTKITLRDTRSRWGSCSANGGLMFSWRLVMAPPEVLDYVAAHEVAHLVEMNHSAAYWEIVRGLCPDYETHRRWLRTNGGLLHRYRFDD